MTDHARNNPKEENGSPRKDELRNAGVEESGARNARPTPADAPRRSGPSTHTIDEGLEGAILDPDERPANRPMGAGAEAAEGMHGAGSGEDGREGDDADAADGKSAEKDDPRQPGSEPLKHRDSTHSSSYGGEMGEPRDAE